MTTSRHVAIAFQEAPVPILIVSGEGRILQTNRALNELFEYESEALIGQAVEILIPDNLRGGHVELREAFMQLPCRRQIGGNSGLFGITRFGRLIPLEIGLNPVDEDGERYVVVSVSDISSIKSEELKFRMAIDASASAMIMAEVDGNIVFANKHACEIFGYALFEFLGLNVDVLVPERHQRRHAIYRTSYSVAPAARRMGQGRELFGKHKDGHEIPIEISLTPIINGDKKLIMATVNEISQRRSEDSDSPDAEPLKARVQA